MHRDPIEDIEKIFTKTHSVSLDQSAKDAIQKELLLLVKNTPIDATKKLWFSGLTWDAFRMQSGRYAFAAVAIIMLVGGATGASANSSLPGDFLYPVKVGINEKIREVLAFSKEAKLKVGISLAQTRLQEAETLAEHNQLTQSQEKELRDNFLHQINIIQKNTDSTPPSNNKKKLQTEFEVLLKTHAGIIEKLNSDTEKERTEPLMESVVPKIKNALPKPKTSIEKDVLILGQEKEKKIRQIEDSINQLKKALSEKKESLKNSETAETEKGSRSVEEKTLPATDAGQHDSFASSPLKMPPVAPEPINVPATPSSNSTQSIDTGTATSESVIQNINVGDTLKLGL